MPLPRFSSLRVARSIALFAVIAIPMAATSRAPTTAFAGFTVTITTPANGAVLVQNPPVTIVVRWCSIGGSQITNHNVFLDGILVSSGMSGPAPSGCSAGGTTTVSVYPSSGGHTVVASGKDNLKRSASATSAFTLQQPAAEPSVAISPTNGATVLGPTIAVTATWCDADDQLVSHVVRLDGQPLSDTFAGESRAGCVAAGTSTWPSVAVTSGSHVLAATATDAAGHVTTVSSNITAQLPPITDYRPQVTPHDRTLEVPASSSGSRLSFAVKNVGSRAAQYQITPLCMGSGVTCTASPNTLTLAAGASDSARITFTTPSTTGSALTLKLSATYRDPDGAAIADTATVNAATALAADLYQPRVTPSAIAATVTPPGYVMSFAFSVTNLGRATATYVIWAWGTYGVTFTNGTGLLELPSVTLGPGQSTVVWLNARAPTMDGQTGHLWLFADAVTGSGDGEIVSDGEYMNVTGLSTPRTVVVRPANSSSQPLEQGVSPQAAGFLVTNVTSVDRTYTYESSCTGVANACRYSETGGATATQTATIPAGTLRYVPVYFDVGSAMTGSVQLLAHESSAPSSRDSSTISIGGTIASGGIRINAVQVQSIRRANEIFTQDFYIVNTGPSGATFAYESGTDGDVFQSCERASGTAILQPSAGDSAKVSVQCTTVSSSGRSGDLYLVATMTTNESVQGRSTVHTATALQAGFTIVVDGVNPGPSVPREQCLTIAVGDNAAYECGELRVVHPLPSTTTMGQTRAPMLVYRNHGPELIAADVTMSPGIVPDSIEAWVRHATVDMPEQQHQRFRWSPQWSNGLPRRIVTPLSVWDLNMNANGAYDYEFVVRLFTPESTFTVAQPSQIAIVNRVGSPFGFLWWLDGLEQLSFNTPNPNQILWIGGDGSTRLYTKEASGSVWLVTPTLDRVDSLTFDAATSTYRRHMRNGAAVEFDVYGRHRTTINAKGYRTTFAYDDPLDGSLLTSISLPVNGGSPPVYSFTYTSINGSPRHLTRVTAPGLPGFDRQVIIGDSIGEFNLPFIARITDPDNFATRFRYASFAMSGRRDKRGVETSFEFYWSMLRRATINMENAADNIVHTFCAAEWASMHPCAAGPIAADSVRTSVAGPRSDVPDTTWFYLNRWGGPSKIENALHDSTLIRRTDARWPLLPTVVIQPNGHRVDASYTNRGLLDVVSDTNPLGDGAVARTRYQWNQTFDKVDVITAPTGELTRFGYDPHGDREWQEDGRGSMSRTTFTYNARRQLERIRPPGKTDAETYRFDYDPLLGNLQRELSPLGATTTRHTDALGRVDSITTPANDTQERIQTFVYDLMDRVKVQRDMGPAVTHARGTAPAVTLVVTTEYDEEGNPRSVERKSEPDLTHGGYPRTEWSYDNAGRKLTETDYSGRQQRWSYDPAGNVKEWTTDRISGGTSVVVRTDYDTLNRPIRRTLPSVTRPAALGTKRFVFTCEHVARFPYFTAGFTYDPNVEAECDFGNTPLPPNLVIGADVAEFTYDKLGNIITANNNDARITRDYYPNGALKMETQAVAIFDEDTPLDDRFNSHRYRLDYQYDLSGRRLRRTDNVPRCQECVQTYHYDQVSGFLDEISDAAYGYATARFGFQYDSIGRLAFRTVNGTRSTEEFQYDADSRLTTREVRGKGTLVYRDDLTYDKSARVTGTTTASEILTPSTRSTTVVYNGLGALAMFSHDPSGDLLEDEFITDGLGNRVSDKRWFQNHYTSHDYRYSLERLSEAIQSSPWQSDEPPPPTPLQSIDSVRTDFATTGSVEYSFRSPLKFDGGWIPTVEGAEWVWHAYGADERLRVTQRSTQTAQHPRTVFSEYHYDALGRRVAVRTRWDQYCQGTRPGECLSTIERTIWDGDQILAEIRSSSDAESDFQSGAFYGAVRYTHGGGIDEPLAIWKTDIGGIIPHRSWRGTYEAGTPTDENSSGVAWPARTQDVFFAPDARMSPIEPTHWIGSLVEGKTDPSGLMYMRNRYYDAKSGRFTQEDPIGLAGGMNLYGFAGGDPVNFADPFGLCPFPPCLQPRAGMFLGAALNGVGQVASNPRVQNGAMLIAAAVAPEETAVAQGIRLYRFARGAESGTRLAREAARAEATGEFPYGVSVTGNPNKPGFNPAEAGPGATIPEIEGAGFPVHSTPTIRDPLHHTVEIPRSPTREIVDAFNRLFRGQ